MLAETVATRGIVVMAVLRALAPEAPVPVTVAVAKPEDRTLKAELEPEAEVEARAAVRRFSK